MVKWQIFEPYTAHAGLTMLQKMMCLDFRVISLINVVKKGGTFPSDHEVNDMNDEHFQNFQQKVEDLYIFCT